ncbi:MAG TPA: AMIN domain-containing protein [Terriglobales bacterium]|nr:AMIN domain-containing protein [Terriglobales bacterium]
MSRAPISFFLRLGLVFPLVVAFAATGLAQNGSASSATVQHVLVREVGGALEVEIQTTGGPVSPNTQAISGPDRIVVDFPGATPSSTIRALKVNRGALKGVRSGLFFSNPPIARIVLDLTGPQSYQISTHENVTVVKLTRDGTAEPVADTGTRRARLMDAAHASRPAHLTSASEVVASGGAPSSRLVEPTDIVPAADAPPPSHLEPLPAEPPQPSVNVTYENGMLSIHADRVTLSQVLYEVHLRTQAEIAIPAGAEQEKVIAELGPAPARSVLADLLNGSAYNFIFVGADEQSLQRVILTRREGSF